MAPGSKRNVNLFEDSPDENTSHVSSDEVDGSRGNLVKINRSTTKKRSARTSSTRRIRMPVVNVLSTSKQNSMNESDLFGFTPEKSHKVKRLIKGSTSKTSAKKRVQIADKNDENQAPDSKKSAAKRVAFGERKDPMVDEELKKMAKEFDEISNYKLIVE